jgi:hypothetical protein
MAKTIKKFSKNYDCFIIIVSSIVWEPFFSQELGELISNAGGLQIMEFTHFFSAGHGNKTTFHDWFRTDRFPKHNLYHPYAFVGIPGLSPGMAFEKLRPN